MAIPRFRYAFYVCGDLKLGCGIIFASILLISAYFCNKYIGMNINSRVLKRNPGNRSESEIKQLNDTYVTTSEKGSSTIGGVSALYFVLSIYGIIGILSKEIQLLIAPMIMLPAVAFIMFVLIFFDLGIMDSTGFLLFWVFTGIAIKIMMIGGSIYSFLVVFSYYMEMIDGPPNSAVDQSTRSPETKVLSEVIESPSQSNASSAERRSLPGTPFRINSPQKTPPPMPFLPEDESSSPRK